MPSVFPAQLSTTVRNNTTVRRFYPYLRPGGVWLNAGEDFVVEGNLMSWLTDKRILSRRLRDAFTVDLENNRIRIMSAGHVVLSDVNGENPRKITTTLANSMTIGDMQAPDYAL